MLILRSNGFVHVRLFISDFFQLFSLLCLFGFCWMKRRKKKFTNFRLFLRPRNLAFSYKMYFMPEFKASSQNVLFTRFFWLFFPQMQLQKGFPHFRWCQTKKVLSLPEIESGSACLTYLYQIILIIFHDLLIFFRSFNVCIFIFFLYY